MLSATDDNRSMRIADFEGYSLDGAAGQKVGPNNSRPGTIRTSTVAFAGRQPWGFSMRRTLSSVALLALSFAGAGAAAAQTGLPTSQPSLVTIIREEVKVGHQAEHARHETGWPAAYGRVNSPDYYLAMASMTGLPEVWYIVPAASHAAMGEQDKRYSNDAAMTAELDRLARADAEHINSARTIHAAARPDLSMGSFPDLARQRFWEITIFRARPGHEAEFDAAAKAYIAAAQRNAPNTNFRTYQVIAGMPGPTYIIFSSVANFADFDAMMADGMKTMAGANAQEQAALLKFSTDGMLSAETNRYRLDPRQSYVSRETRATDPAFWGTMPTGPRPTQRRP